MRRPYEGGGEQTPEMRIPLRGGAKNLSPLPPVEGSKGGRDRASACPGRDPGESVRRPSGCPGV